MALYPQNTRFFLNLWTWGYEDIYKEVARKFDTKVRLFGVSHSKMPLAHGLRRYMSTGTSTPYTPTSQAIRSSNPSSPKMSQRLAFTHASGSSDVNTSGLMAASPTRLAATMWYTLIRSIWKFSHGRDTFKLRESTYRGEWKSTSWCVQTRMYARNQS